MERKDLENLKRKIFSLSDKEKQLRDTYLRQLANGELQGPPTGYPSIDKIWLKYYQEKEIMDELQPMTAFDYLKYLNKNNLNGNAIDDNGIKYTYKKLFDEIDKTARSLYSYGTKKNSIVTVMLPQIAQEVFLLYAVDVVGAAVGFIIPDTPIDSLISTLNEYKSEVFVVYDFLLDIKNEKKIYEKTNINHIVKVGMFNLPINKCDQRTISWQEFINNGKNIDIPHIERSPEDLFFLAKTGGSTGLPKSVMLNDRCFNTIVHQYLNSSLANLYSTSDKWLRMWPLFSATAAVSSNHLPLCKGMELVLRIVNNMEDFDKVLLETRANHLTLVPAFLEVLQKSDLLIGKDLSFVKSAGCGGVKMSKSFEESAIKFFAEHNMNIFLGSGYGCTEHASVATIRMSPETAVIGGTGVPMAKTNVGVFDSYTNDELAYNKEGEICFCSKSFMLGYYHNQELTNKAIRAHSSGDKWLHTGDLGYIDSNGQVIVTGRLKRSFDVFPSDTVYPEAIEEIISSVNGVEGVAIVGMIDKEHEGFYIPVCYIIVNKDYIYEDVIANVNKKCIDNFSSFAVPKQYLRRESFPLTAMKKPNIAKLEEELKLILSKK